MEDNRWFTFSLKFLTVSIVIALLLFLSSFLHTFTGGKLQQGIVPTPSVKDVLSDDN